MGGPLRIHVVKDTQAQVCKCGYNEDSLMHAGRNPGMNRKSAEKYNRRWQHHLQ